MRFCPQCHLILDDTDCAGVPISVCQGCGGCWFGSASLREALKTQPEAIAELDVRYERESRSDNYAGLTAYCPDCRTNALEPGQSPDAANSGLGCSRCGGTWLRTGTRTAAAGRSSETKEIADEPEPVPDETQIVEQIDNEPTVSTAPSHPPFQEADTHASGQDDEEPESIQSDYLIANERYVCEFVHGHLPRFPARKLAIVTCMDARMQVYEILGLRPGDANVIRNAGGIVTEDVLRSLIVSHHLLGTREFLIINHTDCGLLIIDEEEFRDMLTAETGSAEVVPSVFYAFKDIEKNVRRQLLKVRSHPWIPKEIVVRGFVYDVCTGRLTEIL
jgi:carbonic anhydrase